MRLQAACMPGVPTLALTATATQEVQKDILRLLKIKKAKQFEVWLPCAGNWGRLMSLRLSC